MISQVSHVMPNSCNENRTRQRGELLPCCHGNTSYAENTMLWFEKWWFVRFDFQNHSSDRGEGEREEWKREKKDWQRKRKRKKRESDTGRKKGGRRRGRRQGFTRSNLQQCFRQFGSLLSLYFYKESRNTSSAIHFISIPTPASYLHSVSFTSPFHFSVCHYISWMITYWQFLRWHRTGQDATPPASKAGGKWWAFSPILSFFLFLRPSTLSPSPALGFPPTTSPQPLDQIQIFAIWPLWALAGPGDSPGTWGRIVCLASPQQQMNRGLHSSPDWLSWHPCHHS